MTTTQYETKCDLREIKYEVCHHEAMKLYTEILRQVEPTEYLESLPRPVTFVQFYDY
jgi:hypothetical protein